MKRFFHSWLILFVIFSMPSFAQQINHTISSKINIEKNNIMNRDSRLSMLSSHVTDNIVIVETEPNNNISNISNNMNMNKEVKSLQSKDTSINMIIPIPTKNEEIVTNKKFNNVDILSNDNRGKEGHDNDNHVQEQIHEEEIFKPANVSNNTSKNQNNSINPIFNIHSHNFTESIIPKQDQESGYNLDSQNMSHFLSNDQTITSNLMVKDMDQSNTFNLNETKFIPYSDRDSNQRVIRESNYGSKNIVPEDLPKTVQILNNNMETVFSQFENFFQRTDFTNVSI